MSQLGAGLLPGGASGATNTGQFVFEGAGMGVAYSAGKCAFAEFDVPTTSLFRAGKPEWSVIPGSNVGTTRFGPPPSQMPPAMCISVVCRR